MTQAAALQTYRTARAAGTLLFYWSGGPYLEVHLSGRIIHAVNVWDYSTGAARYPFTGAGTKAAALEWLRGTTDSELQQYALQAAHSSR